MSVAVACSPASSTSDETSRGEATFSGGASEEDFHFPRGGLHTTLHLTTNEVAVYTAKWFRAKKPFVFRRLRPAVLGDGLEVLTTRINYMRRNKDGFGVRGYPGVFCTRQWPPVGFGPTEDAIGFAIEPDDIVAVTFFLRASKPGRWKSEGLDIEYAAPGRDERRRIVTKETSDLLFVAETHESALPDGKLNCNPDSPSTWLGSPGVNDRVVINSPTPRA